MAVSPFKTFSAGEVLTASDLNSSLAQVFDNGEDLGWPATKAKDLNGQRFIWDADGDSSITADTDDQFDFELGGTDIFLMQTVTSGVNGLTFLGSATGTPVQIQAQGSDTNIDITLVPKGTGTVNLGTSNSDIAGYFNGFTLSNDTDTDHDINITSGTAVDSAGATSIKLTSEITKQIDATWAVGDDAGGLFSGSVAADTWYHVFVIRKVDGTTDAGFDTSTTAANIPAGYTLYRRLGSVLTDGSANILAFVNVGQYFYWDLPVEDVDNTTATHEVHTLSVPTGFNVIALLQIVVQANAACALYVHPPQVTDRDASITLYRLAFGHGSGNAGTTYLEMLTDTSAQVDADATTSGALVEKVLMTIGWKELR